MLIKKNLTIDLLDEYRQKKRFRTNGVPFAKKMWRDGYNKALDDVITYLEMVDEKYGY